MISHFIHLLLSMWFLLLVSTLHTLVVATSDKPRTSFAVVKNNLLLTEYTYMKFEYITKVPYWENMHSPSTQTRDIAGIIVNQYVQFKPSFSKFYRKTKWVSTENVLNTVLQWNLVIKRSDITKPSYNKVILLVPPLYIPLCFYPEADIMRNLI